MLPLNSKCPVCGKSGFEAVTEEPAGALIKMTFIRCASCKSVVGAMSIYAPEIHITKLRDMLVQMDRKLDHLTQQVNALLRK